MHKLGSTISNIESWYGNTFYKPSDALKNSNLIILKAIAMSKFEQFYIPIVYIIYKLKTFELLLCI